MSTYNSQDFTNMRTTLDPQIYDDINDSLTNNYNLEGFQNDEPLEGRHSGNYPQQDDLENDGELEDEGELENDDEEAYNDAMEGFEGEYSIEGFRGVPKCCATGTCSSNQRKKCNKSGQSDDDLNENELEDDDSNENQNEEVNEYEDGDEETNEGFENQEGMELWACYPTENVENFEDNNAIVYSADGDLVENVNNSQGNAVGPFECVIKNEGDDMNKLYMYLALAVIMLVIVYLLVCKNK